MIEHASLIMSKLEETVEAEPVNIVKVKSRTDSILESLQQITDNAAEESKLLEAFNSLKVEIQKKNDLQIEVLQKVSRELDRLI